MKFRSGDRVQVADEAELFPGHKGEVFKTDALDPELPYKVMLDCGLSQWFAEHDLIGRDGTQ